MNVSSVYVYYEDSRATGGTFALHDLVLACVADILGRPSWELKRLVAGNPKRGSSKVIGACIQDGPRLSEQHVAVLLDGDQLDRALDLRPHYCKRDAHDAFKKKVADARFELFVLDDNIETLIERLTELPGEFPLMADALKKDLNARDSVFARAARLEPARRRVRTVLSFDRFVRRIAGWLNPAATDSLSP